MGICRRLCPSFNLVNIRLKFEVISFPINSRRKFDIMESLFCYFFFLLSHMFPWMDQFLFTENNFLSSLIKKGKLKFFPLYLPKYFHLEYA